MASKSIPNENPSHRIRSIEDDPSMVRLDWVVRAETMLAKATYSDSLMQGNTKRFVIPFGGSKRFPFPHDRVRLTPESRTPVSEVRYAALRYPAGEEGVVFVSWDNSGTPEDFVLTSGQFSRIDTSGVFDRLPDGDPLAVEFVFATTDTDKENLEIVLRTFEPDLQNNQPELQ